MNRVLRHLADAARRRWRARGRKRCEVIFYAGSWLDETWVRSTLLEAARRGMDVALAVGGAPDSRRDALIQRYAALGIRVASPITPEEMRGLPAEVVVSATNGLQRSAFHPLVKHLVHMPHSIVSLHMIYPADSFDAFDTLFACGPHHIAEFERLSSMRGLRQRRALPVGYGKLDLLVDDLPQVTARHVLIAPSWGRKNILNTIGAELVESLLTAGCDVTVRPHPLFILDHDAHWHALRLRFEGRAGFSTENPFDGDGAIVRAGVLVTDYSGVAFEYAALRGRRCVFIDVAKKVVNPGWEDIGLPPVEVNLREQLGPVVQAEPARALEAILACTTDAYKTTETHSSFLFNRGACAGAAADALRGMLASERAA